MNLACSACNTDLPADFGAASEFSACPGCRVQLRAEIFPALYKPQRLGELARPVVDANDASCFFHPEKQAATACEGCGRFLCALCDLDLNGHHYCPQCLRSGQKKELFESYRVSYASMALFCAAMPILIWPLTLVTAPFSLFFAIWGWNKSPSLTGKKRRLSSIAAIFLSLLQVAAWVAVFTGLFHKLTRG